MFLDLQALLDDQIVKIQSMCASPFIAPLAQEAGEWNDLLNTLQDMLDNWMQCQATWQYLEPIFSSPDIMKQMPQEGEKFLQVGYIERSTSQNCRVQLQSKEMNLLRATAQLKTLMGIRYSRRLFFGGHWMIPGLLGS